MRQRLKRLDRFAFALACLAFMLGACADSVLPGEQTDPPKPTAGSQSPDLTDHLTTKYQEGLPRGLSIVCGDRFLAGPEYEAFDFYGSCWSVWVSKDFMLFMGGSSSADRDQGVLYFFDPDSSPQSTGETFLRLPEKLGRVDVYIASLDLACFTTSKGGVGAFAVATRSFLSPEEALSRCPPPASYYFANLEVACFVTFDHAAPVMFFRLATKSRERNLQNVCPPPPRI